MELLFQVGHRCLSKLNAGFIDLGHEADGGTIAFERQGFSEAHHRLDGVQ